MSLTSRPTATTPPLRPGQRLDQVAFHDRYAAMPPGTQAELIAGVVGMPSPVGIEHGEASGPVIVWLNAYRESTPGVQVLDNASVVLSPTSEVQPDVCLRILPESGGQSRTERGMVAGPPELVVEVAHTTKHLDLGIKLAEYERAGVQEYVVRLLTPNAVRWHRLQDGKLTLVLPDADGWYRSTVFPGLWLDPVALLHHDTRRLREVVELGTHTADHADFIARLRVWSQ